MSAAAKFYADAIERHDLVRRIGRVRQLHGLIIEAEGPDVFIGERCRIQQRDGSEPVYAEVVGIRDGRVLLMPYGHQQGMRPGSEVIATGRSLDVPVGPGLCGRVIDAFGAPLDGGPPIVSEARFPLLRAARNPLSRPRIEQVLETGVAAIDTLKTIGRGQRVGIFSGTGVGKSVLLGMVARYTSADINVIALIGERGREVLEFVQQVLGEQGLRRSVVVVATSDQPALVRSHAAYAATAIAEYFRDQGQHVLLTMDSITRFAMARREIGLAAGEPPTARGYTPSVFAALPGLLERGGPGRDGGSITAFYSVLVEADDINDPIGDSIRAILDGHLVLSRRLANGGQYPAIDLLESNSRLLPSVCSATERAVVDSAIRLLSTYETHRDMINIGAYQQGSNPELDRAIELMPGLHTFVSQDLTVERRRDEAMLELARLVGKAKAGATARGAVT